MNIIRSILVDDTDLGFKWRGGEGVGIQRIGKPLSPALDALTLLDVDFPLYFCVCVCMCVSDSFVPRDLE